MSIEAKVCHLMTRGCSVISDTQSALCAAERMEEEQISALPILDRNLRLSGIITKRDLVVKLLAKGKDLAATRLSEVVESAPITVRCDDSVEEALKRMKKHRIRRILVLDQSSNLVGILAQSDISRRLSITENKQLLEALTKNLLRTQERAYGEVGSFETNC